MSKTCERNKALELELNAAKVKIDKQEDEIYYLLDNLDSLEQYTRKNSLEIHGVPKEEYSSTEEAVLAIANALDVDISSNDIEISHHLKRRNNNTAIIVKFANHKDKTKLYKARARLKHGAILYNEAEVFSLSITNPNGRPMLPFDWLIHSNLILACCRVVVFVPVFCG